MRVAIYVRISKDSTGAGAGIARQEEDCRAKAQANNWTVVAVYSDNDISAYSGAPRPGYKAMLDAIKAGDIDAVLCWHVDRLYRRTRELEQYIEICQPRNVPTFSVQSGPLDLATPSGRMVARTLGSVAQYESEAKAERQRRANLQRAQAGKAYVTRRCFGYGADGIAINESEASAIRKAFDDMLRGVSLGQIAREWNSQGLTTPYTNGKWTTNTLGRTFRTHRLAGIRTYHGEIMKNEDGEPIKTEWEAIVDKDTFFAVQAVLDAPGRAWPSADRMLLSGVAVCGTCGALIHSGGTKDGNRRYRCSTEGSHTYRSAAPIDSYVENVILERLKMPDALTLFETGTDDGAKTTELRLKIAEIERRQSAIAEALIDGTVSLSQVQAANKRAQETITALTAQLPTPTNPDLAKLAQSADPVGAWTLLDMDEKRNIISSMAKIEIHKGGNKERAYLDWKKKILNPLTVTITFRES